jgi:hypothetical protein
VASAKNDGLIVRDRTTSAGDFALVAKGGATPILIDPADAKVVGIAARAFAEDARAVCDAAPQVREISGKTLGDATQNSGGALPREAIIAGSLEGSPLVREAIKRSGAEGRLAGLAGQWEAFRILLVVHPLPGVDRAILVVGSDRRGAAYGVFELSRAIGVSPWTWWADVTPRKRPALYLAAGSDLRQGSPAVQYRGIFLNDEDWGLTPWATKTFEPENVGTNQAKEIGPKTYAKIFELLLRLRGNFCWPAMHACTRAFNADPRNAQAADDYAIVMGSSHAEPMLRNNVDEWAPRDKNNYNYVTHKGDVLAYWDERLKTNGRFENFYTLGMRGIHDSPMLGAKTMPEKVRLTGQVIADQRALLEKELGKPANQIPQLFCPYKEVLPIYRAGLKVPDDACLMWADDNFGFIRRLCNDAEMKRSGGAGVYYHVSYNGAPHDFLWLCTTPPAQMWEEINKALEHGANRAWVLNVGDLKPAEIAMDFYFRMLWNPKRYGPDDVGANGFLKEWAGETFGQENAAPIADALDQFYLLNYQRKPELMGWNSVYPTRPIKPTSFSRVNYGDETQARLDAFDALEAKTKAIGSRLPDDLQDAYFELVQYPVVGSAAMNHKILDAETSIQAGALGWTVANALAADAQAAFDAIRQSTAQYNALRGGKWNRMMAFIHRGLPVFRMPPVGSVAAPAAATAVDVRLEGQAEPLVEAANGTLVGFNRYVSRRHFIDLYAKSDGPVAWSAEPGEAWIKLDTTKGELSAKHGRERVWASVDASKAPRGERVEGTIRVTAGGKTWPIRVELFNPNQKIAAGTFVEENGVIAIDAGHFATEKPSSGGARWTVVDGLGRTGHALALLPTTGPSLREPAAIRAQAAVAEYPIQAFKGGQTKVSIEALPTRPINDQMALITAISIDDGAPVLLKFRQGDDEKSPVWQANVLRGAMMAEGAIDVPAGRHVLRLWGADPSVNPDRIVLDLGGLKPSYLGPPETRAR